MDELPTQAKGELAEEAKRLRQEDEARRGRIEEALKARNLPIKGGRSDLP